MQQEVERTTHDALIDYALATYNEELFHHLMNGNLETVEEGEIISAEALSQEEFIKQVNLRAWI
ncbi:hypothetical protein D3C76_1388400 [compost metagenome]